jgi:malonyl-CoA/methylmalonyl-CoA synthetase
MARANLYDAFEQSFAGQGNVPAFIGSDGTVLLTFEKLRSHVAAFANALAAFGVKPGDRVTAQLDKSLGAVVLYLASLKSGAVLQPLNPAYTASEVEYFIADAAPVLVVTSTEKTEATAPLVQHYGANHANLDGLEAGSFGHMAAKAQCHHVTCPRAPDDLAGLVYTSGTTGRPKGAMLTHANLESNARTLHRLWGFIRGDVLLHALPIFHVHGLYVALNTSFLNGSSILWLEAFDVAKVVALLPRTTVFMGVPTFYTRLLADPGFNHLACRSMRVFISGSAPLLPATHAAVFERTGQPILERYGMTETGMIASNPLDGPRLPGTVGFPLPGVEVRVADADGTELPRDEPGVIEVRGPNVCKGYWRRDADRGRDFRPDGYFITGDIGVMDGEGRLMIIGRAKDLVITGGLNVYPREIERALDALAGIEESAVIGVPHPDFGEAVVAVVQACPGVLVEREILEALAKSLARFKLPKRVYVVDELPRNAMGKVQKDELRRRYARTFGAQP